MGFMSSMARCMRDNKLSRKLSTSNTKPRRLDDDSNDLIKTSSNTASLAPAESIASASTMVQHSAHEPVIPTESPAHRKQLRPADLNLQPMFENGQALDAATSRAMMALSTAEYPILKLDTVQTPLETPTKQLQAPLDPGEKVVHKRSDGNDGRSGRCRDERCGNTMAVRKEEAGSKLRRTMTGLLKRRGSLKVPRSPLSMRSLRSPEPRWIDADSIAEECLVDEQEEKWLEAHGLGGGKNIGLWSGEGMGRSW